VDFIKIDGAFVRDITRNDVDFALVRSITEMGHYLKKKVIAEYVSAEDILETVKSIGVDYAQGHVHGLPGLLDHLIIEDPRLLQPVSE
jgi:EAL domain-containing protein (putative c-di-GMP-specific phosphodiesterase class I)